MSWSIAAVAAWLLLAIAAVWWWIHSTRGTRQRNDELRALLSSMSINDMRRLQDLPPLDEGPAPRPLELDTTVPVLWEHEAVHVLGEWLRGEAPAPHIVLVLDERQRPVSAQVVREPAEGQGQATDENGAQRPAGGLVDGGLTVGVQGQLREQLVAAERQLHERIRQGMAEREARAKLEAEALAAEHALLHGRGPERAQDEREPAEGQGQGTDENGAQRPVEDLVDGKKGVDAEAEPVVQLSDLVELQDLVERDTRRRWCEQCGCYPYPGPCSSGCTCACHDDDHMEGTTPCCTDDDQ